MIIDLYISDYILLFTDLKKMSGRNLKRRLAWRRAQYRANKIWLADMAISSESDSEENICKVAVELADLQHADQVLFEPDASQISLFHYTLVTSLLKMLRVIRMTLLVQRGRSLKMMLLSVKITEKNRNFQTLKLSILFVKE